MSRVKEKKRKSTGLRLYRPLMMVKPFQSLSVVYHLKNASAAGSAANSTCVPSNGCSIDFGLSLSKGSRRAFALERDQVFRSSLSKATVGDLYWFDGFSGRWKVLFVHWAKQESESCGSYCWHESSSKKIFEENNNDKIIGFKKLLNFKGKGEGVKNSDWLMQEFSLPEKETNLVLCVLQE